MNERELRQTEQLVAATRQSDILGEDRLKVTDRRVPTALRAGIDRATDVLGVGPFLAIAAYVLLTLSSVTLSSIGAQQLREDPSNPLGLELGTPRVIRGDEWLVQSPLIIGRIASGSGTADTPLATSPGLVFQVPDGGLAESIVFFDGTALRLGGILPDGMVFAAHWWLPSLLLVLAMPPWLTRLGATSNLAWFATGLVLLAPATAWWSAFPIRVLGFAVAGCYLMMKGLDCAQGGRRASAVGFGLAAGVLLARLPTFYVPWAITIGVPVVLATCAWMLWPAANRKTAALFTAFAAILALGLFVAVVIENLDAFLAQIRAVYPGSRRSTGEPVAAAQVFGAPVLGYLQTGNEPTGSNASELSSAYTFTGVWALVVWLGTVRKGWDRERAAIAVLSLAAGLWLVWCSVNLGSAGRRIPLVNLVPSFRAAQTLGYLTVLVLVLVLSRARDQVSLRVVWTATIAAAFATAYGASSMRLFLNGIGSIYVAIACLAVGASVFLVTRYPQRRWPIVVTIALAAAQVVAANPILVGLADLRSSDTAQTVAALRDEAVDEGKYWATDNPFVDALFTANGVPLMSGRQVTGPDRDTWNKLDPTNQYEKNWNRGSSTIEFGWTDDVQPVIGVYMSDDHILINVAPCSLADLDVNVLGIASTEALAGECLTEPEALTWNGETTYLYRFT